MRILIAPNAFKNSLPAKAVADAILDGLNQSRLSFTGECFPIGDGGDGTGDLIIDRLKGKRVLCSVQDPLGRTIAASFGMVDNGRTAVIEMAEASGLRLLKTEELSPLKATSYGTGEMLLHALDHGARKIILCVGGSATTDGGAGILRALGMRFADSSGLELTEMPECLSHLQQLDLSGLDKRVLNCEIKIIVLCDVDNTLLGPRGAAAVFAPQKGADSAAVEKLEAALQRFTAVAQQQTGKRMDQIKHGGAAGGTAAGLNVFLNAQLVNGIDHFLHLTDFEKALQNTDLVITGEGSIDEQTLDGKGPYGVACKAKEKSIPVIGLAGKIPLTPGEELKKYFDVLMAIGNEPADLSRALAATKANLTRTAREMGDLLSI